MELTLTRKTGNMVAYVAEKGLNCTMATFSGSLAHFCKFTSKVSNIAVTRLYYCKCQIFYIVWIMNVTIQNFTLCSVAYLVVEVSGLLIDLLFGVAELIIQRYENRCLFAVITVIFYI